jgi:L-threonylcarbamoyladenylate synthase
MSTSSTRLLSGASAVAEAAELLVQGECVALPTETVYGLAADAANPDAVGKIFDAKGRPRNHPLIVHIPDETELVKWAKEIPEAAYKLAAAFWQGPLTLLLKKADTVNTTVTGGLETIGLRVPSHPLFLAVLNESGKGLAAPSANRYKQLSPTISEQVMSGLNGRIAAVLEGGACEHGLESTIVDLVSDTPRVLRAGPITQHELEAVLGVAVEFPEQHVEVVPGNVKAHYQPNTPLAVIASENMTQAIVEQANSHFVIFSEAVIQRAEKTLTKNQYTVMEATPAQYGKALYATLFQIDKLGFEHIVVEKPPVTPDWRAVNDRLSRAAS